MDYDSLKLNKTVLFDASPGVDQLKRHVGIPVPGDVVKLHMTASYAAMRPLFKVAGKSVGPVKLREKEFLSTHIVAATAFYEVKILAETPTASDDLSALAIVTHCVKGMMLGEKARFANDFESMSDATKHSFLNQKHHKGQYKKLSPDTVKLIFDLETFRIVRLDPAQKNTSIEHFRKNRYGTAAGGYF